MAHDDHVLDLGFSYSVNKNGQVAISRNGKVVIRLNNKKAFTFQKQIANRDITDQQLLMTRVTGNYKRGNERKAKNHPKKYSLIRSLYILQV